MSFAKRFRFLRRQTKPFERPTAQSEKEGWKHYIKGEREKEKPKKSNNNHL
jgi:hypothetical protein